MRTIDVDDQRIDDWEDDSWQFEAWDEDYDGTDWELETGGEDDPAPEGDS